MMNTIFNCLSYPNRLIFTSCLCRLPMCMTQLKMNFMTADAVDQVEINLIHSVEYDSENDIDTFGFHRICPSDIYLSFLQWANDESFFSGLLGGQKGTQRNDLFYRLYRILRNPVRPWLAIFAEIKIELSKALLLILLKFLYNENTKVCRIIACCEKSY